ncbi:CapA family protein [Kytococcus sedentarius]|uniref:CapA family protein n=1 Tax=Kytococcus sedentarius TaxID=1276 RepID=UPI0035BC17F6
MNATARRPLAHRATALGLVLGLGLAACSAQEDGEDPSTSSTSGNSTDSPTSSASSPTSDETSPTSDEASSTSSPSSDASPTSSASEPSFDETGPSSDEASPTSDEASGPATPSPSASGNTAGAPADRPDDPDAGPVTLAVVGDMKLAHRAAGDIAAGRGAKVFAGVADELAAPDLTLGNLETTLGTAADQGQKVGKRYTFMSPPNSPKVLQDVGFDYVSLANNHTYDFGVRGITTTVEHLNAAGLPFSGAGADPAAARKPAIIEANGRRIAVLSYVDVANDSYIPFANRDWEARPDRAGVAWGHPEQVAQDVAAVRDEVDDVLVMMHAGLENRTQLNDAQRGIARAALDAGATAVLGHHAHVLQGQIAHEQDGTFVAWGLGNFVFDGYPEGAEHTDSAILHLTLDDQGVTDVSFTPVALHQGYPVALDPDSARGQRILERLETLPNQ